MSFPPRQPARSEIRPEDMEAYDFVIERARYHTGMADPEADAGYYGRFLLAPQVSARLSQLGRYFRTLGAGDGSYSHADREFVDQVLGADLKTNIVALSHINDAVSAGVRIEAIAALRYGREHLLNDTEKLLAKFIRAVMAGTMDAGTWGAMEAHMGERGTVDYAEFVLFLFTTMRNMQIAAGGQEPSDQEVDRLIADIQSGRHEIDDHLKRIS